MGSEVHFGWHQIGRGKIGISNGPAVLIKSWEHKLRFKWHISGSIDGL